MNDPTEHDLLIKFAGLAFTALIQDSTTRSPGQTVDAAWNLAEYMVAEAYQRGLMRYDEWTRKAVLDRTRELNKQ